MLYQMTIHVRFSILKLHIYELASFRVFDHVPFCFSGRGSFDSVEDMNVGITIVHLSKNKAKLGKFALGRCFQM